MNRMHARMTAAVVALGVAGLAWSADLAHSDAAFLKDATQAGLTEIEASQMATSKATSPQVKAFAQELIADHTKLAEQVKALAATKNVELPKEPSMMQKANLKLIDSAKGANFDERYTNRIGIAAHEDALKLFRKASQEAKDADVKKLATDALPHLEHHLKLAQELKATVAQTK